jgi:type IV secretory pathway ATPase VirB11/archaellum biosynthesis ATPase
LPRFVPTDEQRKIVEKAAGFGLPQEKICQLVISERTGKPVYKKTLAEAFRAELDRGMAVTYYNVAKLLYDQAVGGK